MKVAWERLIRFVATDGRVLRGEPILPSSDFDLGDTTEETGLKAKVIDGDDIYDTSGKTKVTDEIVTVKQLLGPLTSSDVPILRCVGLNYATHGQSNLYTRHSTVCISDLLNTVREAGLKAPPFPFFFFKPSTTVVDHGADVIIPKIAQDNQADYEGELVCSVTLASTRCSSSWPCPADTFL